jgi:hypothetical protein
MTTDNPNVKTQAGTTVLTRRQLISTAAVGGAALVVSGLGGAAVGSAMTTAQYELELTKLRALVALYEQLEKVGIDAAIQTGMNIVRGALDTIKGGVALLRDGVTAAETALKNFQALLDSLSHAANSAGQVLNDLAQKFHAAEGLVIAVLGTALPLADSIVGFFNALLDKIPFGVGDNIRNAVKALTELVRAIPTTIDTLTNQLLKPLRDNFFPPSGDPAVKTSLIDPVMNNVLTPLKKLLNDIEVLADHWEKDFTQPVQNALDQRQTIRKQIAQYRKDNGLA